MKKIWKSKINIAGLVVVLIAVQEFLQQYNFNQTWDVKAVITLVFGILIIILRSVPQYIKPIKRVRLKKRGERKMHEDF